MIKKRITLFIVILVIFAMVFPAARFDHVAQANPSQKFISVMRTVYVPESWADYDDSFWERSAIIKETETFQWFEATIWDNDVSAVHLYKFDQTFDHHQWSVLSSQDWVNYRESYRLLKVDIPKGLTQNERSRRLREAFTMAFHTMVMDTPSQHYGIVVSGHGSNPGGFFEDQINPMDAQRLFEDMTSLIGKKLDFLDMGTVCSQGDIGFPSLWHPYFDYYIASDLDVGGFVMDEDTYEKFIETDSDYQYPLMFTPEKTILEVLRDRLDLTKLRWEYSRNFMSDKEVKQSISLYQMDQFEALAEVLFQTLGDDPIDFTLYNGDLWTYIQSLDDKDDIENKFLAFRTDYFSNKDFFDWNVDTHGLKFSGLHYDVSPYYSVFPPTFIPYGKAGETIAVPLRIRTINGFDSSTITLSAEYQLPPGITLVTFTELSGTTPMETVMSVETSDTILPGIKEIMVFNNSGFWPIFIIPIAVIEDDNPPIFTSDPITIAVEDTLYAYAVTATDFHKFYGDTLTITAQEIPTWLTLVNHYYGNATLRGTPGSAQIGNHDVVLMVEDSHGLTAIQQFTITVFGEPSYQIFLPMVSR